MRVLLPPRRMPVWLQGGGVIAVAMGLMNIGTYGFTLVAARVLGPREYGAVAAVMGLMMMLTVLSLGLQAAGARRVSVAPETREVTERETVAASYKAGLGLGVLTLAAAPLVSGLLRLDSAGAAVLLALALVPLTVMGAYAGIFQGERRWGPLAAIYLSVGLGRLCFGVLGMAVRDDVVGAMAGVAAGNAVPAVLGWWFLRRSGRVRAPNAGLPTERRTSVRAVLTEVAHNSHALLAFFTLSNVDVVIARNALDDHRAGLYAGGLILAKAVLFLPQFVVVIAFPSMVRRGESRMQVQALGLILAMGAAVTAGAAVLAPLAVLFVGGSAYGELKPYLWGFAAVGTLLAMVQLLVYRAIARQQRSAVVVVWAGLAALIPSTFLVDRPTELLVWEGAVHATVLVALLGTLLVLAARRSRSHRSDRD
ncbi:MAG: Capsular polysaccharide biosynthesis protein [uncultured Nocardioidaceae bacterium]|uniref:Capsular polysaccharide biosynthesis protein n=1 Tax=uncultured Nocardioidaceae bacterium TaxID=253824 RepID=A0A6J4LR59_9ACTN|nr:MAG: Capsular polysaccharide biosynthesis protein [uncultured Nocardioidaceae bacterium]